VRRRAFSAHRRILCLSAREEELHEVEIGRFVEDKRATPADIAACRIDFVSWLKLLPGQRRQIG
jgi:hypothetical protein